MLHNLKVIVVLPAYRAAKTVEKTYRDLPLDLVDEVLLVDDAGGDERRRFPSGWGSKRFCIGKTSATAETKKRVITRPCAAGPDIVVMVHPDYQYDPRLVSAMAAMVASGVYDAVLGSRIGTARQGGMPLWKYVANRS